MANRSQPYEVAARRYVDQAAAIRVAQGVARLREEGFRALPLPNLVCEVDGLYLYRFTGDGYVDTVVIRADDCAVAARVHDAFDPTSPLYQRHAVWSENGTLDEVLSEILRDSPGVSEGPAFVGELDLSTLGDSQIHTVGASHQPMSGTRRSRLPQAWKNQGGEEGRDERQGRTRRRSA